MAEREVRVEVVGYLREDACPVNAVDGRKAERGVGVVVSKERFYDVLYCPRLVNYAMLPYP